MRLSLLLIAGLAGFPNGVWAEETKIDYARDIKPVLKARCFACHGALKQKAKLRLDTGALIRQGGRHGPAVRPGNAVGSRLIERVTDPDEATRMPPEGKPLTEKQITLLKAWIDQGAQAPADEKPEEDLRHHWAFQRPVRPALPPVQRGGWARNSIDYFIAAEHERQGLVPGAPADKHILLRRVYLDLIGLPPTREELHAFLDDPSDDAYEKVVDRLLASPQYGERWGRHWMDVWRYSDWYGRRAVPDVMNSYPRIFRWRDWIVRSLNQDKGYDRMIVDMLAADEITPEDDENIVATGFLVRNWYKWNYNTWMKDQVEHTGKAFLGLTLNCCQCHDHKYDPITQEEYFKFRAFFEPLELRHDRVPGEPDPGPFQKYIYAKSYGPITSGMIRVFDEKLDAKTFLYTGGDERNKVEGKPPIPPGAPAALGGDRLEIKPVALPCTAYYPGLKPFVQREESARCDRAVAAAHLSLAAALEKLAAAHRRQAAGDAAAQTALDEANAGLRLAEARLAGAEADRKSVAARIAADEAKYHKAPGNVDELARAASRADRFAARCLAQVKLVEAEQALATARRKAETASAGKAKAAAKAAAVKAEQQLSGAKATVASAQKALDSDATTYTPLSPVYPATSTGQRRALAEWIANRENPLTARVAVNHLWAKHFGRALVETTFNFGRSGKPPSHPALLDWLAVEFMENGWSMKHLHRLMVTSTTYRLRSQAGADNPNKSRDPDNRYLWRFPSMRMQAEVVRDSVLYVAGELDQPLGGQEIDHAQGLVSRRRSLYFAHHGESKMEFLELFDAANPCDCYARTSSIMPQQALAMTNSELAQRQGRLLARKLWELVHPAGATDEAREAAFIDAAFEQVLARGPTAQERMVSAAFLRRQLSLFQRVNPAQLAAHGSSGPAAPSSDLAARAREDLVHSLFSHNDFITVR
jgi:hypothetical protein